MVLCMSRLLRPLGVFLLWMLTSFLCHKLAKTAMNVYLKDQDSSHLLALPALVTLSQMMCCWGMVDTGRPGPLHLLLLLSHLLATLATNTSMALTFASSTMAVKMLEPASSAVLQTVMLHSGLGWRRGLSLLLVVAGAALYVGSPWSSGAVALAVVLAFLSNVVLGVRNVTLKLCQQQQQEDYVWRNGSSLWTFVAGVVLCLSLSYNLERVAHIFPPNATYFLALTLASGLFHVAYSYVSTKVVLRYMSVVSHAVANIFKRVLVVLLLHLTGQRLASPWNWAGLAVCATGLCLYQRYKTAEPAASTISRDDSELDSSLRTIPKPTLESLRGLLLLLTIPYVIYITLTSVNIMIPSKRFILTQRWNNVTFSDFVRIGFAGNTTQRLTAAAMYTASADNASEGSDSMYYADLFPFLDSQTNPQTSKQTLPVVLNVTSRELYSSIVKTEHSVSPKVLNTTDHARRLLLGLEKWTDGQLLINQDVGFQPARKSLPKVREFLRTKPLAQPFHTDGLSPYLTTTHAVIAEAQRLHLEIFRDLLAGKKYAILFGLASFENKGDPAISVGQLVLLEKLGIKLIFYIDVGRCNDKIANKSLAMARRYPAEQVAILMSGGGNLVGYGAEDGCRRLAMKYFRTYQQVVFSESIYMRASKAYLKSTVRMYCCNSNLTLLLRDRQSLLIAKRIFNNGTRLLLAPDMAFHNGPVSRYISPFYDILWLDRNDGEKLEYNASSSFPSNLTVSKGDWMSMPSLKGDTPFQKAVYVLLHGYDILQRGRVVITERLHGHILCVLLDIPHVLLDNNDLKLSSYYNTWTRGISNCRLANSGPQAVHLAMELLHQYNHSLPSLLSAAHIKN